MQDAALVPIGNQTMIPGTFDGYPPELAAQVQELQALQLQIAALREKERCAKAEVLRLMHEHDVEEILIDPKTGKTLSRDLVETVKFRKKKVQSVESEST